MQKLKVLERKFSPQEKLDLIRREYPGATDPGPSPVDPVKVKKGGVPFICVGFEGWSDVSTVRDRARSIGGSVLILRHAIYAGVGGSAKGPVALLMFLEYVSSLIQNASVTIFPTWHYGAMSQARAEHPELFGQEEQN